VRVLSYSRSAICSFAHALATKLEHLALAVAQLADVAGVGPCELVLAQERTHV